MNSIREQIMQALATRLGAARGLDAFDVRDLPLTALFEDVEQAEAAYGVTRITLPVTVAYAMRRAMGDWQTEANNALSTLVKTIYGADETLGGLAKGIDYTGGAIGSYTDGSDAVVVNASIDIRFSHNRGNPDLQTEV